MSCAANCSRVFSTGCTKPPSAERRSYDRRYLERHEVPDHLRTGGDDADLQDVRLPPSAHRRTGGDPGRPVLSHPRAGRDQLHARRGLHPGQPGLVKGDRTTAAPACPSAPTRTPRPAPRGRRAPIQIWNGDTWPPARRPGSPAAPVNAHDLGVRRWRRSASCCYHQPSADGAHDGENFFIAKTFRAFVITAQGPGLVAVIRERDGCGWLT